MSRELVLRNVLDRLRCNYHYILIDCMPSLRLMNINALAAADRVIIPLQPHFLSTKGLNLLLRSVARVRRQINPKLRIDGILFTMVDSRTNNSQSIMSSLRSTVGDSIRVFNTEIPRSVRAVEAAEQREKHLPVRQERKSSRSLCRAYKGGDRPWQRSTQSISD